MVFIWVAVEKKIKLEETTIDHIVPQIILKNIKKYIQVKKAYKAYTRESLGNGLFNLQPMCSNCNNVKKKGEFPPRNIIKRCSNKCCKFIYIEAEKTDENKCKHYLVFTHYLTHEKTPSKIQSVFFTFSLREIRFKLKDGTKTEKLYTLFANNKDKLGFKKNEYGGLVPELNVIKNNQRYSKEELLESVQSLHFQIIQSKQKNQENFHPQLKDKVYKKAYKFFDNYIEALKHYSETIELSSYDPNSYSNRGMVNCELGKYDEALGDYNKAIELKPNNTTSYSNRGMVNCELGKYDEAIEDCNKAISLDSNNSDAYNNRGIAKLKLRKHKEAIEAFDKAIELNPNHFGAYYNKGNVKFQLCEYNDAIENLDKAIELNPNFFNAYYGRGIAKSNLGIHKESIEDFNKAIKLKPDFIDAYNDRGIDKSKLSNYEGAIEDFSKIIKLDANNVHAYNNRGLAKSEIGKYDEAIEDFDKAIELNPQFIKAYNNRKLVKYKINTKKL